MKNRIKRLLVQSFQSCNTTTKDPPKNILLEQTKNLFDHIFHHAQVA